MSIINPDLPVGHSLRLLDSVEVAAILNITPRQVARLRQSGALKSVRVSGAAARHTMAQVEAFIAERSDDERLEVSPLPARLPLRTTGRWLPPAAPKLT